MACDDRSEMLGVVGEDDIQICILIGMVVDLLMRVKSNLSKNKLK
jgi:hypothetical protein